MSKRYRMAWRAEEASRGTAAEPQRGLWRPTQHAAILDAVDLFWRDARIDEIDIFCDDGLVSTFHRSDPRISATLAALEHAVRDIYDEELG